MLYLIPQGGSECVRSVCGNGVCVGTGLGDCPEGSGNPPPDRGVSVASGGGFPEPVRTGPGTPETGPPEGPETGRKLPAGALAKSLDPCMKFRPIPGGQFSPRNRFRSDSGGSGGTPETGLPGQGGFPPVRRLSGDSLREGPNLGRKVTPVWGDFRVQFRVENLGTKIVSNFDKTGHRKLHFSGSEFVSIF